MTLPQPAAGYFRNGLRYNRLGREPRPLVAFMHGATMDHRMFNAQVEALAPHYRVLTWDARGHGKSRPMGASFSLERCAEDMLAILDAQGMDRTILCGQSLGGCPDAAHNANQDNPEFTNGAILAFLQQAGIC